MQSPPILHANHSHHRSNSYTGATAASMRRKPTPGRAYEERAPIGPWEQMSQTYTWVAEQDVLHRKPTRRVTTEDWVLKQQLYIPDEDNLLAAPRRYTPGRASSIRRDPPVRRKTWEEVIYRYEVDAERWMRHEAEVRRLAEERQRARSRIQEELRVIDERLRQRRVDERRAAEEARAHSLAASRERDRREHRRLEKAVAEGWQRYEARWSELASSTEPLDFDNMPWPLTFPPTRVQDITPAGISTFLLSPSHSESSSNKDRIRSAQLRWHPDRFRRLQSRIEEKDKAVVEEGVGIVARCLNDMMEREKRRQS
ncbi:hypothetical protein FA15DRAFT_673164 [Coprinopsis marcescibilis]|uniref:J domain-containing protein n=1 Tax=Coprinopsis marcescibilis TaxID=230819 RepID=A0A5C3KLF5_COPMA|nr:hypothetical protein FA15DRAFT_673164 [Coprinopsis marcescibilis]